MFSAPLMVTCRWTTGRWRGAIHSPPCHRGHRAPRHEAPRQKPQHVGLALERLLVVQPYDAKGVLVEGCGAGGAHPPLLLLHHVPGSVPERVLGLGRQVDVESEDEGPRSEVCRPG